MKFLERLAKDLYENYKNKKVSIVFPTRRAGFFLRKIINENYKDLDINLKFYSMDSWIESFVNKDSILTNLELILVLLEIELIKKDGKISIKEFYNFAKTVIDDFNEIDKNLIDTDDFFKYISDMTEMDEHYDEDSLRDSHYEMMKKFKTLYETLNLELKKRKKTYIGKLYRDIAEGSMNFSYGKVIFAGFNKFSKSEFQIIKNLIDKDLAEIYFDYDNYYINDVQEAGLFPEKNIKQFKLSLKDINVKDNLSNDKKNINISEAATQLNEIKAVALVIENFIKEKKNENELAIILGDITYLVPLLNSLPENINKINIALGYPFKESILYSLLSLLTKLQENYFLTDKFYINDIEKLFLNSYFRKISVINKIDLDILLKTLKKEENFFSLLEIKKVLPNSIYKIFFKPWNKINDFEKTITSILDWLEKINKDIEIIPESELVEYFEKKFSLLQIFLKKRKSILSARLLWQIFNDFFENEYIPLGDRDEESGLVPTILDPLLKEGANYTIDSKPPLGDLGASNNASRSQLQTTEGIQILTLSSAQALDFENIIFVSVNENIITQSSNRSLIPFEVRKIYGLNTYKEDDSDSAYKFYRLLQYSKNIEIFHYNNLKRKGERSRFIEQLEYEFLNINKNSTINHRIISFSAKNREIKKIVVEKRKEVIDRLLKFNISPTALNRYRSCSLSYYLKYALGIESREMDDLDPRLIGTVTHETLEDLYNVKNITDLRLDKIKQNIYKILDKKFTHYIGKHEKGKNFLMFNIIKRSIERFIEIEKKYTPLTIIAREGVYNREFKFSNKIYKDYSVNLRGSIDRIDIIKNKYDEELRIIDYKTGIPHLRISKYFRDDIHSLKNLGAIPFQMLFYGYTYNTKKAHSLNIFAIMKAVNTLYTINNNDDKNKKIVSLEIYEEFEKLLTNIFNELTDLSTPFIQTEDESRCRFCDYKDICGR